MLTCCRRLLADSGSFDRVSMEVKEATGSSLSNGVDILFDRPRTLEWPVLVNDFANQREGGGKQEARSSIGVPLDSENAWVSPSPNGEPASESLLIGILIPLLSSIIPIRRATAKNLTDSLNTQRAKGGIKVTFTDNMK